MLKQRILTAVVLIPLVFISIFYTSPLVFRLILAGVLILAGWEWNNLIPLRQKNWRIGYLLILTGCFYLSIFIPLGILIGLGVIGWLYVSYYLIKNFLSLPFLAKNENGNSNLFKKPIFISWIGIFVLVVCWDSLSFLRAQNQNWVIMLLLIIWIADTAAYFTGRRFGQHFLAAQISPKKTWEGVFGALIAVFTATLVSGWLMNLNLYLLTYLSVLGLITVVVSIIGDLFESLLKRQVAIKDSGQLLPGHGGLLDRIDSLIAAAPIFAGGVLLLEYL